MASPALLLALGACMLFGCLAAVLGVYLASAEPGVGSRVRSITATPAAVALNAAASTGAASTQSATPTAAPVTLDATGQYAFPVAASPDQFVWTHRHWDGINAADIEPRPGLTFPEFVAITNSQLVAVTGGTAVKYSGNTGGLGYMLHGDDGLDYYYAHMSDQWVPDGARVEVGQPLGIMGNTGGTAQFIEPHLHMAIGPRDSLWEQPPQVNTAEWLQSHFGLRWVERPAVAVPPDTPQGSPVSHPDLAIVTPFDAASAQALPQAAVELGFPHGAPDGPLEVRAPLAGVINVIRWTAHYGTRIQITNEATDSTVVISGVDEWAVQDGVAVRRGDLLGTWDPARRPRLHYMLYLNGALADPTLALGLPVRPSP